VKGIRVADDKSDETVLEGAGAYFLSIVEASTDCIRVISADGFVEYMNAQGQSLFEIEDFDGRNRLRYWPDLWPNDSRAAVEDSLRAAMAGHASAFRAVCPTVTGRMRWWDTTVSPILERGEVTRVLATSRDVTNEVLSESHRRLLVNELNHRVKNTLATVQSIASQSLRNAGVDEAVRDALEGRLMAIAATHNVLTDENWSAASLRQIVDGSVDALQRQRRPADHHRPGPEGLAQAGRGHGPGLPRTGHQRVEVRRPVVPVGHVDISWSVDADDQLNIEWAERGGPAVRAARTARLRLADRPAGLAHRTGRRGEGRLPARRAALLDPLAQILARQGRRVHAAGLRPPQTRSNAIVQLVSQLASPSSEKACSQRQWSASSTNQRKRTRMARPSRTSSPKNSPTPSTKRPIIGGSIEVWRASIQLMVQTARTGSNSRTVTAS
jgi:PAS domain S-box-containing protein